MVFAVMPFREEFDDVYKLGIKAACEDAGAYCDRVDEQMYEGMVIERIYQQIGRADVMWRTCRPRHQTCSTRPDTRAAWASASF